MFISKLKAWRDTVDPYAIQYGVFHKALVIATILVFGCWFFRPANYIAYILPAFVLSVYDSPGLTSFKQKNNILLFAFTAMLSCGLTFYSLFPFRVFFLFYSVVFFSALYFLTLHFLPHAKYSPFMVISSSMFFITIEPMGDRQIAYDILCSSLLSMTIALACLRCLRNSYFMNWRLAEQKFIKTLEEDISFTMEKSNMSLFLDEVTHLNMVYSYRGLLKKSERIHAYKMSYNTRNIQFALSNVYYQEKNTPFWHAIKHDLARLRHCMEQEKPYPWSSEALIASTPLERYIISYLSKAIAHWNILCSKR